ncbi:MAG: hypothetical protein JWQ10_2118, partial [Herbaspirillum sp.]|nr:hypothetical protein [Herbaspirillum sp.]
MTIPLSLTQPTIVPTVDHALSPPLSPAIDNKTKPPRSHGVLEE